MPTVWSYGMMGRLAHSDLSFTLALMVLALGLHVCRRTVRGRAFAAYCQCRLSSHAMPIATWFSTIASALDNHHASARHCFLPPPLSCLALLITLFSLLLAAGAVHSFAQCCSPNPQGFGHFSPPRPHMQLPASSSTACRVVVRAC